MNLDEIIKAASSRQVLPDNLGVIDSTLYLSLRSLYDSYRAGRIEKDQAKAEKDKMIRAYCLEKDRHDFLLKLVLHYREISNAVSVLACDFRLREKAGADPSELVPIAAKILNVFQGLERWKEEYDAKDAITNPAP